MFYHRLSVDKGEEEGGLAGGYRGLGQFFIGGGVFCSASFSRVFNMVCKYDRGGRMESFRASI